MLCIIYFFKLYHRKKYYYYYSIYRNGRKIMYQNLYSNIYFFIVIIFSID